MSIHKARKEAYEVNLNIIIELMSENPAFYDLEGEVRPMHRSFTWDTTHGRIIYVLSAENWQYRGGVYYAPPEVFVDWFAHLLTTGESKLEPRKRHGKSEQS